ncbi:MAG: hypothetical protein KFF68_12775 [Desulfosarcina sp.]|nr:hypothetical protein [Desulfosarcina sp.]
MINASEQSNDVRVESWCELCERRYDNSWQDTLLRFRSNYAFRGLDGLALWLKRQYTPRT